MKTIITHFSVDLDCITSTWMIKRFFPDWEKAEVVFTPQQVNWHDVVPDSDPNIMYVDTGYGRFDHHQHQKYLSATKLVFEYICSQSYVESKTIDALTRLTTLVNEIDNFAEWNYPEASSDRWDLSLFQIIGGLKQKGYTDEEIMQTAYLCLDGILQLLKNKIKAEEEIKGGYVFNSKWGKTLSMNTGNDEAMRLAQKTGYQLVITKNPEDGNVRIKSLPSTSLDLTPLYNKIIKKDKKGSWFLHINKNMLLNGSKKKPGYVPSPLSLQQVIEIIKAL